MSIYKIMRPYANVMILRIKICEHDKVGPYFPYKLGAYFLKYCILVVVCYNFILESLMVAIKIILSSSNMFFSVARKEGRKIE